MTGGVQNVWGWEACRTTHPPENFWTPQKERLVWSVFPFSTGKIEQRHRGGWKTNDGGSKRTFWEGCHSWGFSSPPPLATPSPASSDRYLRCSRTLFSRTLQLSLFRWCADVLAHTCCLKPSFLNGLNSEHVVSKVIPCIHIKLVPWQCACISWF